MNGELHNKAKVLTEVLPYIKHHRGKTVVIKFGGNAMESAEIRKMFASDVVLMRYVGINPVIVHGGGKAINQAMESAGLVPQMVMGRRYTDERTLAIAEHVRGLR